MLLKIHFSKAHSHLLITCFHHSYKKQSLETRAELVVLRTYVENKAILEPILLYWASKCKQTKEQGSEDCLWTHIFTFFKIIVSFFSFLCQDNPDHKFFFNFYQELPTCTKPWGQTSKYYRAG